MRELATQKGNGALSAGDKGNIDTEMKAIGAEITNIEGSATFNGNKLLGGLTNKFQVGEAATDTYTFATTAVASGVSEASTIAQIETAIDKVTAARAEFGSAATALESRANNSAALAENLSAARSRIMDADIAQESANMTKASVLQQAGVSVLAQANQAPNVVLSLLR
jgi:flagellin